LRSTTVEHGQRSAVSDDRLALLPVRVVSPSSSLHAPTAVGSSPFEVELRNGVRVRLQPDFDAGAFERVLAVVSRC